MDPITAMFLGSGALGAAGSIWGGGDQEYPEQLPSNLVNVNPFGTHLHRALVGRFAQGLGDFGYGGGVKQGMSQLAQLMGDRGITPDSGVYKQGQTNVIGQAVAGAARNRQNYGLQLASMPMQVMPTSGQNLAYGNQVWNSPGMQALQGMAPGGG